MVFDRLGTKVDMSVPPLSEKDLESLASPEDCFVDDPQELTISELQDLRQVLQRKLKQNGEKRTTPEIGDLRDKLNSNKESNKLKEQRNQTHSKLAISSCVSKPKSPRVEKVFKDPDSKFGSLLTSIDQQILSDTSSKKKDKRDDKHSKSDSKHSSKDSKKSSKSEKKSHRDDKSEKREHKDEKKEHKDEKKKHKDEKKEHKDESKEHKDEKKSRKDEKKVCKDDKKEHKDEKKERKDEKRDLKDEKKEHRDEKKEHREEKKELRDEKKEQKEEKKESKDDKKVCKDEKKVVDKEAEPETKISEKLSDKSNIEKKGENSKQSVNETKTNAILSENHLQNVETINTNIEARDTPVYRRLADKYNPRPRKSIEISDRRMSEESNVMEINHRIPPLDNSLVKNFNNVKEIHAFNKNTMEILRQHDPRLQNEVRQNIMRTNVPPSPWYDQSSPSFESSPNINLMNNMIPNKHVKTPLLSTPPLLGSSVIGNPFLSNSSAQSTMQMNFPPNNIGIRQHEHHHQFIPPQQNMLPTPNHGSGNTYMNTFILQNNVSGNIPHSTFNNPAQSNFHNNQITPTKVFHPYEPIDNSEYDLSKMQPTDFYSPSFTKTKRPLLSPPPTAPTYGGRVPYGTQFSSRDQQRPPFGGRMALENKPQWQEKSQPPWERDREREESYKTLPTRDPRIRAREMKERSSSYSNTHQIQSRRKSTDASAYSEHNKYDSLYSNMDRVETFASPLDSLYSAGEEKPKVTGKGYGVQKFRIPKKRTDSIERQQEDDREKDIKKQLPEKGKSEEVEKQKTETEKKGEEISVSTQELTKSLPTESSNANITKIDSEINQPSTSDPNKSVPVEDGKSHVVDSNKEKNGATDKTDEDKASAIENAFLTDFVKKVIEKSEKKELLSILFSTLTDTILTDEQRRKKFRRIQKLVDSSDSEEEEKKTEKTDNKQQSKAIQDEVVAVDKDEQSNQLKKANEDAEPKTKSEKEIEAPEDLIIKDEESSTSNEKEKSSKANKKKNLTKKQNLKKTIKKAKVQSKKIKQKVLKKKTKRKKNIKPKTSENEEDNVIESVGERIKNRRRNIKTPEPPKVRRCKTELDLLHEDIKEMFIRDGVLTATGKRMCRMLKTDTENTSPTDKNIKNKPANEETSVALDSPKRRARAANPKVIIEKADLSRLVFTKQSDDSESENETMATRLRKRARSGIDKSKSPIDSSSNASDSTFSSPVRRVPSKRAAKIKPNYIEETDEDPLQLSEHEEVTKSTSVESGVVSLPSTSAPPSTPGRPTTPVPDNTPITASTPTLTQKEVTPKKNIVKKRKRGQKWASGVITKEKKKKPSSNPVTPTPPVLEEDKKPTDHVIEKSDNEISSRDTKNDTEFVKPDTNYYFDPQDKPECKVCSFKGKMIVQHYRTVHPRHEVLISRISPDNAKKAIDECLEKKYEEVTIPEVSEAKYRKKRFTYQCRLVLFNIINELYS